MKSSLKEKIAKIEDEHFEQAESEHLQNHAQIRRDEAMRFLGGAMAIDRLKEHLASQVIAALITIEEQNLYLDYGFSCFAEFLNQCDLSPMSKSTFYRMRDLYLKEGPAKYDLLSEIGIPFSTRKLLESGDIAIDGDDVIVGGEERINMAESRKIKAIIEKLVKGKIDLAENLEKKDEKIESLVAQNKKGKAEIESLQRNFDSYREAGPFANALMGMAAAFKKLIDEVKKLPDEEKKERGVEDCKMLARRLFRLQDAYGIKIAVIDEAAIAADPNLSDFDKDVISLLSENDDWGDEEAES